MSVEFFSSRERYALFGVFEYARVENNCSPLFYVVTLDTSFFCRKKGGGEFFSMPISLIFSGEAHSIVRLHRSLSYSIFFLHFRSTCPYIYVGLFNHLDSISARGESVKGSSRNIKSDSVIIFWWFEFRHGQWPNCIEYSWRMKVNHKIRRISLEVKKKKKKGGIPVRHPEHVFPLKHHACRTFFVAPRALSFLLLYRACIGRYRNSNPLLMHCQAPQTSRGIGCLHTSALLSLFTTMNYMGEKYFSLRVWMCIYYARREVLRTWSTSPVTCLFILKKFIVRLDAETTWDTIKLHWNEEFSVNSLCKN